MDKLQPRMRVKIWLEHEDRLVFGPGCAMLLREIERSGSLSGAVRNLGMSYRAAWGHIKKVEENLGRSLVVKTGGNKSGYSLSAEGLRLLEAYEAWLHAVQDHAFALADELFPWPVRR
ncbi:LysR family transcriptional regulator [Desulfocurvus sp.]|jgi:molybdate transport system regulatory protein|uniref:winged helix-turn-helix domain-containing protein n=1 Tax=Desulfocurvus sp. TaxID=2871698 RepID=UPI0025C41750|nr:LysR family transcriptional regulator [Desulfocurvus sp.]MCK9238766.1 LysR family transcriptional regulator [Desulfocurvus sp.]